MTVVALIVIFTHFIEGRANSNEEDFNTDCFGLELMDGFMSKIESHGASARV